MTLFLFLGFQCSHPFGGCKLYYPQITTGWSCLPLHSRCSQLTDPFGWSCGGPKWTNNGKPSETVEESQIIYRILIRRNIYSKMLHSCVLFLDHVVVFFLLCAPCSQCFDSTKLQTLLLVKRLGVFIIGSSTHSFCIHCFTSIPTMIHPYLLITNYVFFMAVT